MAAEEPPEPETIAMTGPELLRAVAGWLEEHHDPEATSPEAIEAILASLSVEQLQRIAGMAYGAGRVIAYLGRLVIPELEARTGTRVEFTHYRPRRP